MEYVDQPSWNVQMRSADSLDALLYIREALRIPVFDDLDPPVPVTARVPDSSNPATDLLVLTQAWRRWWRNHVARELLTVNVDLTTSALAPAWARQVSSEERLDAGTVLQGSPISDHPARSSRLERLTAVFNRDLGDPPRFIGLKEPLLRRAAIDLWPAASAWAEQRSALHSDYVDIDVVSNENGKLAEQFTGSLQEQELIEAIAHDAAFDAGVLLGQVHACVVMVDIPQSWWQRWAPGAVVCSRISMEDASTARTVLYETFRSSIND